MINYLQNKTTTHQNVWDGNTQNSQAFNVSIYIQTKDKHHSKRGKQI